MTIHIVGHGLLNIESSISQTDEFHLITIRDTINKFGQQLALVCLKMNYNAHCRGSARVANNRRSCNKEIGLITNETLNWIHL